MGREVEWHWQFLGFESSQEGRPVQDWFNKLPKDVRDEICDLLGYLEKLTRSRWRKPEFDPLEGEGGISELRPMDVRLQVRGKVEVMTCRIYGFFGPRAGAYTFLHGKRKDQKNDRSGKRIAKRRLLELTEGTATVHDFEFQELFGTEAPKGS